MDVPVDDRTSVVFEMGHLFKWFFSVLRHVAKKTDRDLDDSPP